MKKRSEVTKNKSESSKPSAAERTLPMFKDLDVKNITVTCEACDAESRASKLSRRADGSYECPECGAPVEIGKETKKLLDASSKKSTPSPEAVEKKKTPKAPPSEEDEEDDEDEDEEEEEKPRPKREGKASGGIYCAICGTQWPMVDGKPWPNCGHNKGHVDDPSMAKKISPPAGHQMPSVKKVRVTLPEAMFRVADFCTFRTPSFELEAEIKDGEDWIAVKQQLLAAARRAQDEAFNEIHASYMQKLEFIKKDLDSRE